MNGNLFGLSLEDKGKIAARASNDGDEGEGQEAQEEGGGRVDMRGLQLPADWVVRRVTCGYRHTAFITTSGLLLTCGHGETGRLGHGDEADRSFPTVVQALCSEPVCSAVVGVGCGREHTVAVLANGDVYSWGWGECGRLGVGEVGKTLQPTRVPQYEDLRRGLSDAAVYPKARDVACGREHTLIISEEGQVFVCGPGFGGRLGLGNTKDVIFPTLVSWYHLTNTSASPLCPPWPLLAFELCLGPVLRRWKATTWSMRS